MNLINDDTNLRAYMEVLMAEHATPRTHLDLAAARVARIGSMLGVSMTPHQARELANAALTTGGVLGCASSVTYFDGTSVHCGRTENHAGPHRAYGDAMWPTEHEEWV